MPTVWALPPGQPFDNRTTAVAPPTSTAIRESFSGPTGAPRFGAARFRLEHTSLDTDGDGRAHERFTFQGRTCTLSERVGSEREVDWTDAIGYYPILDNVVSLDVGLNLRLLDGGVEIKSKSTGETASESLSGPVKLACIAGRVDVPSNGPCLGGQVNAIAFGGR